MLDAESGRIRALHAALVDWVQAVANATAHLEQKEAGEASALGAALADANETEAQAYASADFEERHEQSVMALLQSEDTVTARARAQQEAGLSSAIKGLQTGLAGQNTANVANLARIAQVNGHSQLAFDPSSCSLACFLLHLLNVLK